MKKFYLLVALLLTSGCVSKYTHMGVVIPENTSFSYEALNNAAVVKNVKGSDSNSILLFIPLGHPNFETAVNNTLKNGRGNVLINAKVKNASRWYVLFGSNSIEITGDVVNIPQPTTSRSNTYQE